MGAGTFLPDLKPRDQNFSPVGDGSKPPDTIATERWMEAAYEEARYENLQDEEVKLMSKYIDYLVGKQWGGGRPSYKSKPIDNRIWRLFWELVGLLTDVRPLFQIKALRDDYKAHADILNKCTRSWWMESDADLTLAMIVIYGLMSTGFAKYCWDPTLRNGEGDFDFIPISPENCMPLKPSDTRLQSSQLVVYQKPMPLAWFRRKFGKDGWRVKADVRYSRFATPGEAPSHLAGSVFDMLTPQMKRIVGKPESVQDSYYPMALYREFWAKDYQINTSNVTIKMGMADSNWAYEVKPGELLYPRGRLFCMGGPHLMHDGPNPYWHGQFPFGALRLNMVPWKFHGMSEMKPLIDMQDVINNILAGVMDMVKKAVNPNFIAPKNAFSDAAWNAMDWSMPGAKAQYNPGSPHPPSWAPAPQLPAFVLAIMQLAAREMDASSGIASIAEAVRKKQVPSADTLESIKQTQQTPIRLKGRNMEVFLRHLGSMSICNTFQFYSAKRRLFMLGPSGLTFEDFDYDPGNMIPAGMRPEDHIRNFVFLIQPGTLLNVAQDQKAAALMTLRKMGDLDRKTLIDHLDLGIDADKVSESIVKEKIEAFALQMKAQAAQAAMGGGAPQGK